MVSFLHFFLRTVGLFFFWVLLSGKLNPAHLGMGAATAAAVAFISMKGTKSSLSYLVKTPIVFFRLLYYLLWLMTRVLSAAWHVTCLVWHPKMPINPKMIRHRTSLTTDTEKAVLGTAITLTSGTLTAEIKGDEYFIHQLDDISSADVLSGIMDTRVRDVFQAGGK